VHIVVSWAKCLETEPEISPRQGYMIETICDLEMLKCEPSTMIRTLRNEEESVRTSSCCQAYEDLGTRRSDVSCDSIYWSWVGL